MDQISIKWKKTTIIAEGENHTVLYVGYEI